MEIDRVASKAAAEYLKAALVWVFTLFVLVPLAHEIHVGAPLHSLVATIAMVAIAAPLARASRGFLEVSKGMGAAFGAQSLAVKCAVVMVDSAMVLSLLWVVSPVLGGLTMLIALILVLVLAFLHPEALARLVGKALRT